MWNIVTQACRILKHMNYTWINQELKLTSLEHENNDKGPIGLINLNSKSSGTKRDESKWTK